MLCSLMVASSNRTSGVAVHSDFLIWNGIAALRQSRRSGAVSDRLRAH
jgi:hypothetical protein